MKLHFAVAIVVCAAGCGDSGKVPFADAGFPVSGGGSVGHTGGTGGTKPGTGGFGGTSGFGGSGGSACATDWHFTAPACDSCMRSSCCAILQACDTGTACRSVDNCRFSYCTQASNVMACMQTNCNSSGFSTWQEYWSCLIGPCATPCAG